MPLTKKGKKIKGKMKEKYGKKKGEEVFHASANAGTIKGVEGRRRRATRATRATRAMRRK